MAKEQRTSTDGIVGKATPIPDGNKVMMDWIKSWIGERTSWDGGVLIVMGLIVLFATNQLNLPLRRPPLYMALGLSGKLSNVPAKNVDYI